MKTALILPGGGTKGALEIGACKAIFEKIRPDMIIGTSVGSLNGAALADGKDLIENLRRTEQMWKGFKRNSVFPLNFDMVYRPKSSVSVFSNKGLYSFIKKMLKAKAFEDLSVPLSVSATDAKTGKARFFSEGELYDPLVASCSAIPVFPPVRIDGKEYIDGGFSTVFGVDELIGKGCRKAVIINIDHYEDFSFRKFTLKEYAEHAIALIRNQNVENELRIMKDNKIRVVKIDIPSPTFDPVPTTLKNVEEMLETGEKRAREVLKRI